MAAVSVVVVASVHVAVVAVVAVVVVVVVGMVTALLVRLLVLVSFGVLGHFVLPGGAPVVLLVSCRMPCMLSQALHPQRL